MEKKMLANHFMKLSPFLFSLLILISLTIGPVYTDSASGGDNIDVTMEMIRGHVEEVRDKDSDIDKKLRQLEEKLATGMSFKDPCTHCHADKMRQGGKQ